jgi:hypothetical protein
LGKKKDHIESSRQPPNLLIPPVPLRQGHIGVGQ